MSDEPGAESHEDDVETPAARAKLSTFAILMIVLACLIVVGGGILTATRFYVQQQRVQDLIENVDRSMGRLPIPDAALAPRSVETF